MLSRKANRAAVSRSNPRKMPAEMVDPERLSPGAMARAWKKPDHHRVERAHLPE